MINGDINQRVAHIYFKDKEKLVEAKRKVSGMGEI